MGIGGAVVGLVAAVLSFVWMPAAIVTLRVAAHFVLAGNFLAGWFAQWPMAWVRMFTPTAIEIALAYALLLAWQTWPRRRAFGARRRGYAHYAMVGVLMIAVAVDAKWWFDQRYHSDALRVTFLSVGEGDAAVVRFPGSRVMLLDGAPAWRDFDLGERVVARYLWAQKIMHVDVITLSHPDQDHFGGLEFIARNFAPGEFWTVAAENHDASYEKLLATMNELKVPIRLIDATVPPMSIEGVQLAALNRPAEPSTSRNNASMVLRLARHNASILFTGDLEAPGEAALLGSGAQMSSTVVKVPHHGSATSSSAEFVEATHPRVAVMSLGYRNRFHFPAAEVVERYRAAGAELMRTDEAGAIEVDIAATGATVHSYRNRDLAPLDFVPRTLNNTRSSKYQPVGKEKEQE